ncbi:MAG: tryptophan synthase subunit alpha [SAR324 cluster bacterium]|nr:tryptophan synthase subunit alpha [SAR324 cluster bacterium]
MNLTEHIQERLRHKRILLMTHAVVGFPSLQANWDMLEIMQKAGVDLVELQLPFTEPSADGELFVKANQAALKSGIRIDDYFAFMQKATAAFDFPIFMMSYYNPVFVMGHQTVCQRLKESGSWGYILPDLPVEEYGDLFEYSKAAGLHPILLCAPTNTPQRLRKIAQQGSGFLYCVARKGVTGAKTDINENVDDFITRCRDCSELSIALGFGLSKGEDIQDLHGKVEIAIVGSALLRSWLEKGPEGYQNHLTELVENCFP